MHNACLLYLISLFRAYNLARVGKYFACHRVYDGLRNFMADNTV